MGDVGSAVATPFVAVGAVVTGQANKKIYYDCPRCGKEVWVYVAGAAFSGRKCVNCRGKSGPLDLGIVGDAIDVAATPFTGAAAIITGNANERIYYNCPKCGERKWVSAMAPHLSGKICFKCKPLGHRSVETLHPFGQAASINKIEKDSAKFKGTVIYQQWGQRSDQNKSHLINQNDKIKSYETKWVRIIHGAAAWTINAPVQIASLGQAPMVEHWWLNITTENGNYYQLQFRGGISFPLGSPNNDDAVIELRKCSGIYDCNQTGLAEADKTSDTDPGTIDASSYSYDSPVYTMGDVIKWMKDHDFSAKYKLFTHNCQDLCKAFYDKF